MPDPFAGQADFNETADKNDHADFGTPPGGNLVYSDLSMVPRTTHRDRVGGEAKESSSLASGCERVKSHHAPAGTLAGGEPGRGSTRDADGRITYVENTVGRWPPNVILADGTLFDDPESPYVVGGGTSGPGVWGTSNQTTDPDRMFNGSPGRSDYRSVASVQEHGPASKSRYFLLPRSSNAPDVALPQGSPTFDQEVVGCLSDAPVPSAATSSSPSRLAEGSAQSLARTAPDGPPECMREAMGRPTTSATESASSPCDASRTTTTRRWPESRPETHTPAISRASCVGAPTTSFGTTTTTPSRPTSGSCVDRVTHSSTPDETRTGNSGAPSGLAVSRPDATYPKFLLVPKASRKDRDSDVNGDPIGLPEELFNGKSGRLSSLSAGRDTRYRNTHTTTKSRALMRWLVRLIASKGALVLDPFAGSGTTGLAAHDEGCDYLLIEQDPDYVDIARARLGDSLSDRHDTSPGASPHSPM